MYRYSLLLEFCASSFSPEIRFSSTVVQGVYMHTVHHYLPANVRGKKRNWWDKYWLLAF